MAVLDGGSALARVTCGLGKAGRQLVADHLGALTDWDPRSLALLRQAAEARDRQVELAALLAEGVLLRGPRGRLTVHPLLRHERQ